MQKFLLLVGIAIFSFVLSGCSALDKVSKKNVNQMPVATFIKSIDSGLSWIPKIKIDDKKTIAGIDVLTMAIDPINKNNIYLGTAKDGIFISNDYGETWKKSAFPEKVYGIVFDYKNSNIIYASGILNDRAKIYKKIAQDQEWKEVYSEPANGTIISSLVMDPKNNQVLYAGTNEGVIIKTIDAGKTWINLKKAENQVTGPVTSIIFDGVNSGHLFFGIFQSGILESRDGGLNISDITNKFNENNNTVNIFSLISDSNNSNIIYAGTDKGIFRKNSDDKWESINIIESSKQFPIRSIVINPKKSSDIVYSSAKALYKSNDAGKTWSVFQLDTSKEISILKYDSDDSNIVYAGLRSF